MSDPAAHDPDLSGADPEEISLVAALRAGDERAFEQLVRQHGGPLLKLARRFMRNEEDARDVVQEAFLSAVRGIEGFGGGALVSTWLHRIVVNAALMKLRSHKRRPEGSIDDLLPRYLDDGHPTDPAQEWTCGADTLLQKKETCAQVRAAIDTLPETYRNVLLLRDIQELSTDETAQVLDLTPNAVKIRLHRARQALREILDPHFRKKPRCSPAGNS